MNCHQPYLRNKVGTIYIKVVDFQSKICVSAHSSLSHQSRSYWNHGGCCHHYSGPQGALMAVAAVDEKVDKEAVSLFFKLS